VGAHQLVRVRIVGDDVAATRDRDRIDGVGRHSYGARKLHSAVLVGVFQADIENCGLVAAIQAFLQLFFCDAFDGHGAILAAPRRIVKVGGTGRLCGPALRGCLARHEGQGARRSDEGARGLGADGNQPGLVMHRPSIRPLAAMYASKKDGSGCAGDAEVMSSRQVAVQPIPHVRLCFEIRDLLYRKVGAARLDRVQAQPSEHFPKKLKESSPTVLRLSIIPGAER
jgi:hypothetical protein